MLLSSQTETHTQHHLVLRLLGPCGHFTVASLWMCAPGIVCRECSMCPFVSPRCIITHVPSLNIRWTWAVSFFSYQGRRLIRTFVYKYLLNSCFLVGLVGSMQQRMLDYIIFCWLWGTTILTVPLYFHKKCLRVSPCLHILIYLHFIFL